LSSLLQQFVWIALLQGRPQDLPAGQTALAVAFVLNVLTYLAAVSSVHSISESLLIALTDLTLSGLCLYGVLILTNRKARFQQAFTALCGATAVLNLAAAPIFWLSALADSPGMGLANLAVILWSLSIIGHVLQHTLEWNRIASIGLAVAFYLVISVIVFELVIGGTEVMQQELSNYQSVTDLWSRKA